MANLNLNLAGENFQKNSYKNLFSLFLCTLASVRVLLNLKNEIIQRNGEQYFQINSIDSSFQILCDYKTDIQLNTRIPEIMQNALNEQANSKWKQLKPLIETQFNEHIAEVLHKTLAPVFENIAYKHIFL